MDSTVTNRQALPVGTRLEEFVVERVLGAGSFGITYLARDENLGRQVVIKENLPGAICFRDPRSLEVHPGGTGGGHDADFRSSLENFGKEGAMLARLDHPGIVKVLRSFSAFGTGYFVMPHLGETSLNAMIEDRQRRGEGFTEEEVNGVLSRILRALGYLHEKKVYHRDIKPNNILITSEGLPVLIDFGASRQKPSERTMTMTVVGTPGYAPYEQWETRGKVGPWTDLYALGGTMVKMITGETPPNAMDRERIDPYRRLAERRELVGRFGRRFLMAIDRALEVKGVDRWQNAGEWMGALRGEEEVKLEERRPERGRVGSRGGVRVEPVVEVVKKGKAGGWIVGGWVLLAVVVMGLMVWKMSGDGGAEKARLAAEEGRVAAERRAERAEAEKQAVIAKGKKEEAERKVAEEAKVKAIAEEKAVAEAKAKAEAEAERKLVAEAERKAKEGRVVVPVPVVLSVPLVAPPVVGVGKAEMVLVEGGQLPAGSEVREKRVGRFWVGKYEVTWGEWKEVREWAMKKGYELEEGRGGGEKYPVTNVSWYQALKWCNARSEMEGLPPVYTVGGAVYRSGESVPTVNGGNGYRLPRDGEWEWAARGGVKGNGYEYSGSKDFGEVGWYGENSGGKTHEVGTKRGNELGIYDMSGNVWEWCFDQLGYTGTYRVNRGGSLRINAYYARVSYRNSADPSGSSYDVGFRVVRSSVP